jgi:hypothetical protein
MSEATSLSLETDKIVAAIFPAAMCVGKQIDHTTYMQTYDGFLALLTERQKKLEAAGK